MNEKNKLPVPPNLIAPVLFSYSATKIAGLICATIIIVKTPYWWLGGILFVATLLVKAWFSLKPIKGDTP